MRTINASIVPDPEGRFAGLPLRVSYVDGRLWRLEADASYRIATGPAAGQVSTVRAGFVFDWASIPRPFWVALPPAGTGGAHYGIAACWHDWYMVHHAVEGIPITRRQADDIFHEIMVYVGVSRWLARVMWIAVRAHGIAVGWPSPHVAPSGPSCHDRRATL